MNNNNNNNNNTNHDEMSDEAIAEVLATLTPAELALNKGAPAGEKDALLDGRSFAQVIAGVPKPEKPDLPDVLRGEEPVATIPKSQGKNAKRKALKKAKAAAKPAAQPASSTPPKTEPKTKSILVVGANTDQQTQDLRKISQDSLPASIAVQNDNVKRASGQNITRVKGTSNGFDALKSKPIRKVKYQLDADEKKYVCTKIFPEYNVLFSDESTHGHPLLSLERARGEEIALELASKYKCAKVLDVGGAAIRHYRKGRTNVHSCCPMVVPADTKRHFDQGLIDAGQLNACDLSAEDCLDTGKVNTGDPHGPFDCAMFVHSVYYFNPDALVRIMRKTERKMAVIVCHDFTEYNGALCLKEAQWTRKGEKLSTIEMVVRGGSYYSHPAPDWMKKTEIYHDGSMIQLSPAATVGSTQVILAFLNDTQLPPPSAPVLPTTLAGALRPEYEGLVDFRSFMKSGTPFNKSITALFTPNRKYYAIGSKVIGFDCGNKILSVPKSSIPTIAFKVAMRPRDADLYQFCAQHAKSVLKASTMREEEMTTVLPFVTAAAFLYTVESELAALEVVEESSSVLDRLNKKIGFKFEKPWYQFIFDAYRFVAGKRGPTIEEWTGSEEAPPRTNFWPYAATAVAVAIGVTMMRRPGVRIPTMSFFGPVGATVGSVIKAAASRLYTMVSQWLMRSTDSIVYIDGARTVARSVCAWPRPLKEIHESANVEYDPLMCGTCKPGFGNQLIGVGVSSIRPTTFRSCYCNQVLAVVNRGLLDRGDDKDYEEFWERVTEWEMVYPTIRPCRVKAMPWNAYLMRYPKSKRDALERAKKVFDSRNRADNVTSKKSFIKVENAINIHERSPDFTLPPIAETDYHDGPAISDPRLIQGCLDEHKGRIGPWIVSFSKCLAAEWCGNIAGQRNNFYYTSGSDANAVGAWFCESLLIAENIVRWGEANGLNLAIVCDENDYERFDATTNVPSLNFSHKVYQRHGITKKANEGIIDQKSVHGCTNGGVRYSIKGTNASGGDDTSTGNTLRNKEVKHAVVNSTAVWSSHAFLGDDSAGFVVLNTDTTSISDFAALQEHVARQLAGFRPEPCYMCDARDMTFCSSYFWPAKVNGEETYILGPKIGRVLAKTFYATKPLNKAKAMAQVRGICLGLQHDVKHIPVLRVLIPKLLELTAGIKATAPPREDHKFHASVSGDLSDNIWSWVEHVYGIESAVFIDAERVIRAIKSIPCLIDHPAIDAIVGHDCPPKGSEPKRTSQIVVLPDDDKVQELRDQGSAIYDTILAEPGTKHNTSTFPPELDTERQAPAALPNATLWSFVSLLLAGVSTTARLPGYLNADIRPLLHSLATVSLWAPLVEEAAKRMSWTISVALPCVEFLGDFVLLSGSPAALAYRAVLRLGHFGLAHMPYAGGVAVHALHNGLAWAAARSSGITQDALTSLLIMTQVFTLSWTVRAFMEGYRPKWRGWRWAKKLGVLALVAVGAASAVVAIDDPNWLLGLVTGLRDSAKVAFGFSSQPGLEMAN